MTKFFSELTTQSKLAKYNIVCLKKSFNIIETFYLLKKKKKDIFVTFDFNRKKKRPELELLKQEEKESFNIFNFSYPLGYLSGCNNFIFRVTFKEYKIGLKAAKFSLLLNQFNLNLEKFILLVQEILINNFPLNFYENFFQENLNDIDFKIHFLVILRTRGVNSTTTKFFIVPKGCFFSHLKEILWPTLFLDSLFLYSILTYYKGLKKHLGLVFVLILFYLYRLLHNKMSLLINKHKIYNYEERAFESFGNIFSTKTISYKLYCKSNFQLPRYSYLLSTRCIDFFIQDSFEKALELKKFTENNLALNFFFDLFTLDEHLLENKL